MPIPDTDKCLTSPTFLACTFKKNLNSLEVKVSAYKTKEAITNNESGIVEYEGITIPIPAPIIMRNNSPVVLKRIENVIEDFDNPSVITIKGIDFSNTQYTISNMNEVNYQNIIPNVGLDGLEEFICGIVKESIEAGYASKLLPDADGYVQIKSITIENL